MNSAEPRIGFIGIGALGGGLTMALAQQGYRVAALHSRRLDAAQRLASQLADCEAVATAQSVADAVDLVFITTPDAAIAATAAAIHWRPGQGAVHCCGAAGTDLLAAATAQGAVAGAFHPLQTFAGLTEPAAAVSRLSGVTFAVSASGWLQGYLDDMARQLGGRPVVISDDRRPLYHAAAVLSCGYLATLLQAAVELGEAAGFRRELALEALLPLSRATLGNIETSGIAASVTGPAARGDAATVTSHLEAIAAGQPQLFDLYRSLTEASLKLTVLNEDNSPAVGEIHRLLAQSCKRWQQCTE